MRDPNRIPRIVKLLEEAWKTVPDWRLCQFVSNLHGTGPQDIFHTEDDTLEESLKKFIEMYKQHNENL